MIVQINLKKAAGAVVLLAAAVAGLFAMRHPHAAQAPAGAAAAAAAQPVRNSISFADGAPQWASIKVEALQAGALPLSEPLNGRVVYDEDRTARISSPIAGRVTRLQVEPGDQVRAGAVLATIDAPDLATAQADWHKAHADEQRKHQAYDRAQTLYDGEVLARKDYESAQADYQQAVAETQRAAQRLKNLNASTGADGVFGLRAPLAGVVAERRINPGQEVRPDLPDPLFVVSDLHQLSVMVDVPERSAGSVHAGQKVSLDSDAWPGEHFAGTVAHVGQTLDPVTHRVQVRCVVPNADLKLKPEMFVRVALLADDGAHRAVQLPNGSLFVEGMYEFVFVETRHGNFEKRRVHIALRGHDSSYADSGLNDGERVVTEGAFLLNAEVAAHAE